MPNFGRFSPTQILLGAPLQNLYPRYHACMHRDTSLGIAYMGMILSAFREARNYVKPSRNRKITKLSSKLQCMTEQQ